MPLIGLLLLLLPTGAQAHGLFDEDLGPLLGERLPVLLGAALLAAAWIGYEGGCRRRPPARRQRALLHAGFLLAALSLFGPLDEAAETSAAVHMLQHMLLMLAIAPLLVLARPLPQWRSLYGPRLDPLWLGPLRLARWPLACAVLHGALIWIWHAPGPYRLALDNLWWHFFEHACFLFSAWLFWWSVLRAGPRNQGRALLALLLTSMHTGLLGALLSFARVPLYREADELGDQQLAGLLMWVPGGLVYLAAALWCGQRWWQRLLRRSTPAARP
ncbi:cytochrome c oxidase assembly protein [Azotobacter salinestris]|uniref:cytochrome c oxidase assembly protein n=1 Tax=Azotobacter salinestris TaxID=69964 RepID=UPI0032DEE7E8